MGMSGSYNYNQFCMHHIENATACAPAIGRDAPNFTATTLKGKEVQFHNLITQITVLEIGSITCPMFHSRRQSMTRLVENFPEIRFVVLYVREAHPGERIPHHTSIQEKCKRAIELKTTFDEKRMLLVDNLEGSAHQLYGAMPNSIFVITPNKKIAFKSNWNDVAATKKVLSKLRRGEAVEKIKSYFKPVSPVIFYHTVKLAGKGAWLDFLSCWTLIFEHLFKGNIREYFRKQDER